MNIKHQKISAKQQFDTGCTGDAHSKNFIVTQNGNFCVRVHGMIRRLILFLSGTWLF